MAKSSELLLNALQRIREGCEAEGVGSGLIDNVNDTIHLLKKIINGEGPKSIGIFGAQKRGKSTLINVLLRCDLMPVCPVPMSSVVIKVKNDKSLPLGAFNVQIVGRRGEFIMKEKHLTFDLVKELLKEYGSHRGRSFENVSAIYVAGNFLNSEILTGNAVLVDTPGAELAFEEEGADAANSADIQRALDILDDTHIIVFVERADYSKSENSRKFYREYLRSMRPLCVVNFKDKYELDNCRENDPDVVEKQKQDKIKSSFFTSFDLSPSRVFCVSAREGADAIQHWDKSKWRKSNIPDLEDSIKRELANLSRPDNLMVCLEEIQSVLEQVCECSSFEKAKAIFQRAKAPFYVFFNKEQDDETAKKAKECYERYC